MLIILFLGDVPRELPGRCIVTSLAVRYAGSPDPFKNYKGQYIQSDYYFWTVGIHEKMHENNGIKVNRVSFLFIPDTSIFLFIQYLWSVQIKFLPIESFKMPHKAWFWKNGTFSWNRVSLKSKSLPSHPSFYRFRALHLDFLKGRPISSWHDFFQDDNSTNTVDTVL